MRQVIRNQIFETNSSSTHALAIYKENLNKIKPEDLYENIAILDEADGFHTTPKVILSFIYTIALLSHNWKLVDKLKETFPNCIFQKPQWELPDGKVGFCDDREIITWCDLYGPNFYCKYDSEDMNFIYNNLIDAVCNSELYVQWDGWYEYDIVKEKHLSNATLDEAHQWVEKNILKLIEHC